MQRILRRLKSKSLYLSLSGEFVALLKKSKNLIVFYVFCLCIPIVYIPAYLTTLWNIKIPIVSWFFKVSYPFKKILDYNWYYKISGDVGADNVFSFLGKIDDTYTLLVATLILYSFVRISRPMYLLCPVLYLLAFTDSRLAAVIVCIVVILKLLQNSKDGFKWNFFSLIFISLVSAVLCWIISLGIFIGSSIVWDANRVSEIRSKSFEIDKNEKAQALSDAKHNLKSNFVGKMFYTDSDDDYRETQYWMRLGQDGVFDIGLKNLKIYPMNELVYIKFYGEHFLEQGAEVGYFEFIYFAQEFYAPFDGWIVDTNTEYLNDLEENKFHEDFSENSEWLYRFVPKDYTIVDRLNDKK